jgi:release factor glutamine methyltransferase
MNEAELLFTELFNCDRLSLYLNRRSIITKDKLALISRLLQRRIRGQPIQYILGKTEFMGLKFKVAPCVFIPRPETEILIEKTIETVKLLNCQTVKLLDIGTGSGCIAISLSKFLPNAIIDATDISAEALKIAKENADLNRVNINFIQSNLFDTYNLQPNTYDLIISNPPYIISTEIDNLQPEIQYEPRVALDGGKDGLEFYRKIISLSPYYLKNNGLLIMEMGFKQTEAIRNIFKISGKFEILEVAKDYNNIDRVVVARKGK